MNALFVWAEILTTRIFVLVWTLLVLSNCHQGTSKSSEQPLPGQEIRIGSAIECRTNDESIGPPSYAAGVGTAIEGPVLRNKADLASLRQIRRTLNSPTLRYAYVSGEFIVYNAKDGPCGAGAPYDVINGRCSEGYAPLDRPNSTISAGQCFEKHPRPRSDPQPRRTSSTKVIWSFCERRRPT
jgi:hypothetical protein